MPKITVNKFPIEWRLSDLDKVEKNGCKVFGTFICGGGSSMGYKLAGYDHLGGVEFMEHYAKIYRHNLNPKYLYQEDIREFVQRADIPEELYGIDLLDGSPPCAAFSLVGKRERLWGKKSDYENTLQQKDDLPFVYAELILKLKPKVFLLENVSGLIKGNAKAYLANLYKILSTDYKVQLFLLNAATMGCPQMRHRAFVIGLDRRYELPPLELDFDCETVPFSATKKYWYNQPDNESCSLERYATGRYWGETNIGEYHKKHFSMCKPALHRPCPTLTASCGCLSMCNPAHPLQKRGLNREEFRMLSTFPLDYDFLDAVPQNVMGRSVLPVMMANISNQIYEQWLSKIKDNNQTT